MNTWLVELVALAKLTTLTKEIHLTYWFVGESLIISIRTVFN